MAGSAKAFDALMALAGVFSEIGNLDRQLARAFKALDRSSGLEHVHLYMAADAGTLQLKASSGTTAATSLGPEHPVYGVLRTGKPFKGYVGRMGVVAAVPLFIDGRPGGVMVGEPPGKTPEALEDARVFLSIAAHFFAQAIAMSRSASMEREELVAENYLLLEEASRGCRPENLVYASGEFQEVVDRALTVARSNADVLILGETGTGKELIASMLHYRSARSGKPLVRVNCAALPPGLLESELFGHVKGAFTGAVAERAGRFQLAHGGSIFLDEITEIPFELQPKLLRVLQEREFEPVGASDTRRVDVRVIAASNRSLEDEIKAGRFRKDLYYRLNVLPIVIPPLRRRKNDIPPLVEYFMARSSRKNFRNVLSVTPEAMAALVSYPWPGNVRELENAVEHAVVLSDGPLMGVEHLPLALRVHAGASAPAGETDDLDALDELAGKALASPGAASSIYLDRVERVLYEKALETSNGNRTEAAKKLGVSRNTFARRLKQLRLDG